MTFDLQAAREIAIKLTLRYPAKELIDVDYQNALAGEMLSGACDEIARLQTKVSSTAEWYAVRIRVLEDYFRGDGMDLPIAATFWNVLANGHRSPEEPPTYAHILAGKDHRIEKLDHEVSVARNLASLAKGIVDDQAARIKQLEDWLVEERANKLMPPICYCKTCASSPGFEDRNRKFKEKYRAKAREQLHSEDKL